MKIVIADSRPEIRSALRLIIEHEPGFFVEGEAIDTQDLMVKVKAARPDLVVFGWEISRARTVGLIGESGKELLSELRLLCSGLRVLVLSSQPGARKEALSAGADVFVSKGDPPEYLIAALREMNVKDAGETGSI